MHDCVIYVTTVSDAYEPLSLSTHTKTSALRVIMAPTDIITRGNIQICMLQRNWKFSDLASLLSLSRCFVLRYMRWAMSSMAHNLKNRPRFITVRISKLNETESTGFTLIWPLVHTTAKRPCQRQNTQPLDVVVLQVCCSLTSHSSQPLLSWCSICVGLSFLSVLTYRQINKLLI